MLHGPQGQGLQLQRQQQRRQQRQRQQRHQRQQLRAAAAAASDAADPLPALRSWVEAQGGRVDARLAVTEAAPSSGCRGVVATSHIPLEDLEARGPLIVVPQRLQFDAAAAARIIAAAAGPAAADAAVQQLPGTLLLAAALAHELLQPDASAWAPYLASLPARPPNPWLLTDTDEVAALVRAANGASRGAATGGWLDAVAAARRSQLEAAGAAVQLVGSGLRVGRDEVLAALGHVASRSLTSGSASGLLPAVDLLNHAAAARAPMLQLADESDALVVTVLPIRGDEAVELSAGEELCIRYDGGHTPLQAFLKFGFVADEWWQPQEAGEASERL